MGCLLTLCRSHPTEEAEDFLYDFINNRESYEHFERSFIENPEDTMMMIFKFREERSYKTIYLKHLRTLSLNHPQSLKPFIKDIPSYGTWKDILILFDTPLEDKMIKFYCKRLEIDFDYPFSLAGKYAPNEKGYHDKKYGAVSKFCKVLKMTKKTYRRSLSCLREHYLLIFESCLGSGDITTLNIEDIPRLCLRNNKKKIKDAGIKQPYKKLQEIAPIAFSLKRMKILESYINSLRKWDYPINNEGSEKIWTDIKFFSGNYPVFRSSNKSYVSYETEDLSILIKALVEPLGFGNSKLFSIVRNVKFDPDFDTFFCPTPENVARYIVESTEELDGVKNLFLFLGLETKRCYEEINSSVDGVRLIFWEPGSIGESGSEGIQILEKEDQNMIYIKGFRIDVLERLI